MKLCVNKEASVLTNYIRNSKFLNTSFRYDYDSVYINDDFCSRDLLLNKFEEHRLKLLGINCRQYMFPTLKIDAHTYLPSYTIFYTYEFDKKVHINKEPVKYIVLVVC